MVYFVEWRVQLKLNLGAQTLAEVPVFYLYWSPHPLPPTFDC